MAKVRISRPKRFRRKYVKKVRLGKRPLYKSIGMRLPNKYSFKRQGWEASIINTAPGAVSLQAAGALTGWAIGSANPDANGLYQFGGAMQFQLDQTQNYTDFTQLFDRYKLSGVKVKFVPLTTQAFPGASVPMIAYAIDLDDATLPTSYDTVNTKYNVHKKRLDKACSIYIKPRLAQQIYSGLTSGYAIGPKNTYIDCNDPGVPHYGLKFWLRDCYLPTTTGPAVNTNTVIRIETTYYLTLKDSQ